MSRTPHDQDQLERVRARLELVAADDPRLAELLSEIVYAATHSGVERSEARDMLRAPAAVAPICAAWLACLADTPPEFDDPKLRQSLVDCSTRGRAIVRFELLRQHMRRRGARRAWAMLAPDERPTLTELAGDELSRRSPLTVIATRTGIELSSVIHDEDEHARWCEQARALFDLGTHARACVELCIARSLSQRDRHEPVLALEHLDGGFDDVALALSALTMRSLVAAGTHIDCDRAGRATESPAALVRVERLRHAWARVRGAWARLGDTRSPGVFGAEPRLATSELEAWYELAEAMAVLSGLKLPELVCERETLQNVELEEQLWRRSNGSGRAGLRILARYEQLLHHSLPPEARVRVRLAWCRMLVDLHGPRSQREWARLISRGADEAQQFKIAADTIYILGRCELVLTEVCEQAAELGRLYLRIQAHDQRTSVLALLDRRAEARAEARHAGELVLELLAHAEGDTSLLERGQLQRLWPVLDRGIEIQLYWAMATDTATELLGIGRELHALVEQAQVLALGEARRVASEQHDTQSRRFVWTGDAPDATVLSSLRKRLGSDQAVLQFFRGASFVIVFLITRDGVTWDLLERPGSEDPWWTSEQLDEQLEQMLGRDASLSEFVPAKLVDELTRRRSVRHVFVILHAELWGAPFGRLRVDRTHTSLKWALTYAPCARVVLDDLGRAPMRLRRPRILLAWGDRLEAAHVERERDAVRGAHRRIVEMDAVEAGADAVLSSLEQSELGHMLVHGSETLPHTPGQLLLGAANEPGGAVASDRVVDRDLVRCRLLVLEA